VVALDDELQWVTQRRRTLQRDRLATDDTQLQEPAPRCRSATDSQDASSLAAAELVKTYDRRRGWAPLAAPLGDGTPQRERARQEPAGAVLAILIGQVGFHVSIAAEAGPGRK